MVKKHCAWGQCNSDTRKIAKGSQEHVEFFKFPKPIETHRGGLVNKESASYRQCLGWIKACGRPQSDLNIEKIINDYKSYNYSFWVCAKVNIVSEFHFHFLQYGHEFLNSM